MFRGPSALSNVRRRHVFVHKRKNMATSVHGDDFTSVGPKAELDWLEAKLESRYELRKGGRLGLGMMT